MDQPVSIGELARLLDCEQWRARQLVDIVTRGQCPRIGLARAVPPTVVKKVRARLLESKARGK